jgi:hypothetical protein
MAGGNLADGSRHYRKAALRALRDALGPELRALLDTAPADVREKIVAIIASGQATAAQAAEAWTLTCGLVEAAEAGEIEEATGTAAMERLAYRHIGAEEPD